MRLCENFSKCVGVGEDLAHGGDLDADDALNKGEYYNGEPSVASMGEYNYGGENVGGEDLSCGDLCPQQVSCKNTPNEPESKACFVDGFPIGAEDLSGGDLCDVKSTEAMGGVPSA